MARLDQSRNFGNRASTAPSLASVRAHTDFHGRPIARVRDTNRIVAARYGRRGGRR